MALIETEETNRFTYERFAAHTFYTDINRSLVQQALAHLPQRASKLTIVDMACGTGAVTRLIAEELARQNQLNHAHLIGVDPSAEALRHAQTGMDQMGLEAHAEFIQGDAEDLPNIVSGADAAFFCNAIHLVPDKRGAFEQMSTILAPGGIFACNSAFYEGTYVPGTERFYRLWTRRAVGWLKNTHPDVHLSREAKAMAMQWLSPEEYIALFKKSGFSSVEAIQTAVSVSLDAWRDLGQYWLFIDGALPGAPLAYGAEALETAVYQVGQELGTTEVPRMWLQLVATKA
ncbi:MAG: class I SAM-dependent methyltransferase [Ktedonobacteraceae bacterium]|nr:class I SAM-dependent methyltransferase [Ktedonobacteraceae bacterium]MBV9709681.1 class I SAM-dependent methyltransferase [Ktedonobacteraceae bacterium]